MQGPFIIPRDSKIQDSIEGYRQGKKRKGKIGIGERESGSKIKGHPRILLCLRTKTKKKKIKEKKLNKNRRTLC